jgi:hypothetical protein
MVAGRDELEQGGTVQAKGLNRNALKSSGCCLGFSANRMVRQ